MDDILKQDQYSCWVGRIHGQDRAGFCSHRLGDDCSRGHMPDLVTIIRTRVQGLISSVERAFAPSISGFVCGVPLAGMD